VKIEHCGVVTDTGFEVFYRAPKHDLIICGLPGEYYCVDDVGAGVAAGHD
jgi:hypothetical protein